MSVCQLTIYVHPYFKRFPSKTCKYNVYVQDLCQDENKCNNSRKFVSYKKGVVNLGSKKDKIEILIEQCKRNERTAQMELYKQFSQMMYHSALNILKNPILAEDALQESFITAFDKLHQYRGKHQFAGWLKQIVVNTSISLYHRETKSATETLAAETKLSEDTPTVDTNLDPQKLHRALALLKPKQELLLKLYYLEGYDHQEISDFLGISYANCRTSLSRAREQLKLKLAHIDNDYKK